MASRDEPVQTRGSRRRLSLRPSTDNVAAMRVRQRHSAPAPVALAIGGLLLGIASCAPAGQRAASVAQDAHHPFVGTWEILPEAAGPRLVFQVDSARGAHIFGHVVLAFAGNVGDDPAAYSPFVATVNPDSTAGITIHREGLGDPLYEIVARPEGDRLKLRAYRWNGVDLLTGGRRWIARRIERPDPEGGT